MDFDRIFPLIIIMIVWGIGSVLRNLPKKDQQDSDPVKQRPGLLKILQQGFAALEEKSREDERLDLDGYLQPIAVAETSKPVQSKLSLIDQAERAMAQDAMEVSEKVAYRSPSPEVVSPPQAEAGWQPGPATRIDRRKLRNAVIWAEILASPVALRD
jgi:hypothetical protein